MIPAPRAPTLSLLLALGGSVGLQAQQPERTPEGSGVGAEYVEIVFLDVGQGDAVFVRAASDQTAMIDAGRGDILRALTRMGVDEIDLLVASHPHADHIGGLADVLTTRPVRFYLDNGQPHTTATYERLMGTVERLGGLTYLAPEPRIIRLGEATLEVLPLPPPDVEHNNRSVGLVLRFGEFSAFFSGDSEREELSHWLRAGVVPDVDLLKAPHHGSSNGFTHAFLEAAKPEVVVVSVGSNNAYGHPRPEAMTAFRRVAPHLFRTDHDGHITVRGYRDGAFEIVLDGSVVVDSRADSVGGSDAGAPASTTANGSPPIAVRVVPGAEGVDASVASNAEYVVVENLGTTVVGLGGWLLCDLTTRCFRFPPGASIDPGRDVVVYTGYGATDGVSFFMNNDKAVWNDDGDEATLYDPSGEAVLRHVYE